MTAELDEIAVARARRRLAGLRAGELDAVGRRLLVGRDGRRDDAYRAVLAIAAAGTDAEAEARDIESWTRWIANALPQPRQPRPALPRPTHRVEVRHGELWYDIKKRGTEAETEDYARGLVEKWPNLEIRVAPILRTTRRKKGWSVADEDHVHDGERVYFNRPPDEIHPSIATTFRALNVPAQVRGRIGVVRHRVYGSGHYACEILGTRTTIYVPRSEFTHPIPDGVHAITETRTK